MIRCALLGALLIGCGASPSPRIPATSNIVVAKTDAAPVSAVSGTDTEDASQRAVNFPPAMRKAHGCFASTPYRRQVVCVVGQWSHLTIAAGQPEIVVLGEGPREQPSYVVDGEGELSQESRKQIDEELASEGWMHLPPPRRLRGAEDEIQGFGIRVDVREVVAGSSTSGKRFDSRIVILDLARSTSIDYRIRSMPCRPQVTVRELSAIGVLFESTCDYADGPDYGIDVQAWLCTKDSCN